RRGDECERLGTRPGLPDDLEVRLRAQHCDETVAHDRVIVRDEDADRTAGDGARAGSAHRNTSSRTRQRTGARTSSTVPSPGELSMHSVPPSSRARSFMPTMPK